MKRGGVVLGLAALALSASATAQEQLVDPDFHPHVEQPAYPEGQGPVVVIDGAHRNFHRIDGQYAPFAALLTADGYRVVGGERAFGPDALEAADVLVVANALPPEGAEPGVAAFTDAEEAAVEAWVRQGGRLLLIADHAPFGSAAEGLAARFGVEMGKGWVFVRADSPAGLTTQITYARDRGLGDHPINAGVETLRAFTGQSLVGGPEGAAVLMRLPDEAWEVSDNTALDAASEALLAGGAPEATAAGGRAQGLVFPWGRGRVAVLAEAGMLSAQLIRFPPDSGRPEMRFGMNVAGLDNARFARNVLHWLSEANP